MLNKIVLNMHWLVLEFTTNKSELADSEVEVRCQLRDLYIAVYLAVFGPNQKNFPIAQHKERRLRALQIPNVQQRIEMAYGNEHGLGLELELEIKETMRYSGVRIEWLQCISTATFANTKYMASHHVLECWCSAKRMFSHQHAFQTIGGTYHMEFTIFWLLLLFSFKSYILESNQLTIYGYGVWHIFYVPLPMYNYKFIV